MKSGRKLTLLLLWHFCFSIQSQDQSYSIQYWYNDKFSEAKTQSLSAINNEFTNVIFAEAPSPFAINKLSYRIYDNQGRYSSIITMNYFKGKVGANEPTLQYWYNNDSTSVSRLNFPVSTDGSFSDLNLELTHLPFGINKISFRFTDGKENCSSVASFQFVRGFYGHRKTVLEYWFDDNFDNRVRKPVTDEVQQLEFNASTDQLEVGVHTVHLWVGYENDLFTAPHTSYFVKLSMGSPKTVLEYWIDDDVANKTQHKLDHWENMVELNLNTATLSQGVHKLSVRAGNQNGLLSPITTSFFFKGVNKYAVPVTDSKIVNYRYWFDDDMQNMYSGRINDITQEITFLRNINTNIVERGKHSISVQFQNSHGQWSDVAYGEFEKNDNKIISVPKLIPDKILLDAGSRLELSGYQFSKNGKLIIECRNREFLRRDTLYANNYGRIEHGFTIIDPGIYLIKATDFSSGISNVGYYVKVIPKPTSKPVTFMNLLFPDSNHKTSVGNTMYIRWNDIMKIDNRYPLDPFKALRAYEYDIEIASIDGEVKFSNKISGTAGFEQLKEFVADATFDEVGTYRVLVRDTYTNAIIQSESIEVINNTGIAKVSTEWDYSILTEDGSYHRMGNPEGVAADGTGRIYLTIESELKTISQVHITLTDGINNSPELLGKIMPATITNRYSNEANDALFTIASSNKSINKKHWFWYVAPIDFVDNNSQNITSSEREVTAHIVVTYDDLSSETIDYPIKIVRPPIMLVHGLGSNAERCWSKFSLHAGSNIFQDPLYKSVRAIDIFPDMSFERNAKGLLGENPKTPVSTFTAVLKSLRIKGYSANRVDYICHSMGGCVLRYATNQLQNKFYSTLNYEKGFTNKVITINTPHDGSPWPDAIQFMLDMFYDNKYIAIANNIIPYIYNLNDLYEKYRDDNTGINPFWFIRPTQIEQNKFQSVANWGHALFNFNWELPYIRKFTLTPAVRDLGMEYGIRFDSSTRLKAHMIASDIISGEQKWPKIGPIESIGLDYVFSFNKNMKKFLSYWAEIGELIDRFKITDTGVIKFESYSQLQRLDKELEEIMLLDNPGFKLISTFDTYLKRVNGIISASNGVSFLINSDLIVPYRSQIAGAEYSLNHTTFSGIKDIDISEDISRQAINQKIIQPILNINHLSIVENNQVQKRIAELLNTSINDGQTFNGIPGYSEEPNFSKNTINIADERKIISKLKSSASIDTSKIKILTPENNIVVSANSNLEVLVMVKDTQNFHSITAYFQGGTYTDVSKEQGYFFNIPINGDLINDQQLIIKATYYDSESDSSYMAYTGKIIHVFPTENPISFNANDKVLTVLVGDTVHTSYETIFPRSIYKFSIDKNIVVNIDKPSLIVYDYENGDFIAKSKGNTFAEISYMGLKDTVYFVMESPMEIATSLQKIEKTNTNFPELAVYPNPAKYFTTITSSEIIDRIELCDIAGRVIENISINSTTYLLNLSGISDGVYLIRAYTSQKLRIGRFVKE